MNEHILLNVIDEELAYRGASTYGRMKNAFDKSVLSDSHEYPDNVLCYNLIKEYFDGCAYRRPNMDKVLRELRKIVERTIQEVEWKNRHNNKW